MKKIILSILVFSTVLSLCACNMRKDDATTPAPTTAPTTEPATEPTEEPTKLPLETNIPDPDVDDDHMTDPTVSGNTDILS